MGIVNNALVGASGQAGYNLSRSLRFRSSASASLSKNYATTRTSGQKLTYSAWVKRGTLSGSAEYALFSAFDGSPASGRISFNNDRIAVVIGGSSNNDIITNAVYRDPSAWYHIVVGIDTTQATNTNRVKLYVNGVQVTAFGTTNYPAQNSNFQFLYTGANNRIAVYGDNSGGYFDGYIAELNVVDGQQLEPSSFGETSTTTGVWQPKKYTGTYGTNGFYLPFTDNSALTTSSNVGLGRDFSGNGNFWVTNNISITAGVTYDSMTDVPTNTSAVASNFAVINPLDQYRTTISNGNLTWSMTGGSGGSQCSANWDVPNGKWYWECTMTTVATTNMFMGLCLTGTLNKPTFGTTIYINASGTLTVAAGNGTAVANGPTYTSGDVLQFAFDRTNGRLWFGKNGTWSNSGDPGAGTNFNVSSIPTTSQYSPSADQNIVSGVTSVGSFNFGQRPFAHTAPTGFVSLNTFNLPTPSIGFGTTASKYMDVSLYTGTGSALSVTNSGSMQPDFLWIKGRSAAYSHALMDSLRGVNKVINSNTTDAEATESAGTGLTSFNSNGFSLGTNGADASTNVNTATFVAWQWRASNAAGVSNTNGTITSTVSANTTSGFSVVTYTGTGVAATVGHGLGVAPKMVIVKQRNTTRAWFVYHSTVGAGAYLVLNSTDGSSTVGASGIWNSTAPTSSVFSIGSDISVSGNGSTYVAYCFSEIAGYSRFGSYTGNGSADGTFVFTGFRPRYILIKRTDAASYDWYILDTARNAYNQLGNWLTANGDRTEGTTTELAIDFLSNGFKPRNTGAWYNANGGTYIYAAFAESPFKYANAR